MNASRTVMDDGVEFEVVWHGGFHLECGQPTIVEIDTRSVMDKIRLYLEPRAGSWRTTSNVAEGCGETADDVKDRLRHLVDNGTLLRQKRQETDRWQWVYTWANKETPVPMPKRKVKVQFKLRFGPEKWAAMRACLKKDRPCA